MAESRGLFVAFTLAAVCYATTAYAQLDGSPESVGMSTERLERINELIERKIEQKKLVGAVTAVARNGKLIHFESHGHADLENQRPMTTDTVFRIYSMTKPVTTVAAMMLHEEGKYQLHDPVADYLPEFQGLEVLVVDANGEQRLEPPRRPMTIRDLMTHTSGLTYGIFGNNEVDQTYREKNVLSQAADLQQMVETLGEIPLLFHPGERWHYSVSTDVLGRLVEVTSGQTLDDFFEERIFAPLSMVDTSFAIPDDKLNRFPTVYRWSATGGPQASDRPESSPFRKMPKRLSGGGGLVSTTSDYLKFCQMLLNGGRYKHVRILSPKSVQLMTQSHLDDAQTPTEGVQLGAGASFGLGFRILDDPARSQRLSSRGTYGWGGMASTMFFVDPQERMVGLVMSQKLPTDLRLRDEFQTAVYQAVIDAHE